MASALRRTSPLRRKICEACLIRLAEAGFVAHAASSRRKLPSPAREMWNACVGGKAEKRIVSAEIAARGLVISVVSGTARLPLAGEHRRGSSIGVGTAQSLV